MGAGIRGMDVEMVNFRSGESCRTGVLSSLVSEPRKPCARKNSDIIILGGT